MKRNLDHIVIAAIVGAVAATSAVAASDADWTDERICAAGLQSYFYLQASPSLIGAVDGWHAFRSASGATYDCQINDKTVAFKWRNDNGPMSSKVTTYVLRGSDLSIATDMTTDLYALNAKGDVVRQ